MESVRDFLSGKKTYILAGVALLVICAYLLGVIDENVANTLLGILGFGGLITLRAGIAKSS